MFAVSRGFLSLMWGYMSVARLSVVVYENIKAIRSYAKIMLGK